MREKYKMFMSWLLAFAAIVIAGIMAIQSIDGFGWFLAVSVVIVAITYSGEVDDTDESNENI